MQNQETTTQSTSENRNAQKISQLEESIRVLIPQLRSSHGRVLSIEKKISRLTDDDPYEGLTEELEIGSNEVDSRTFEENLGEPLEFDTPSFDENNPIDRSLKLDDVEETDMNELELIELQDRLNTQYLHIITEFRNLANQWFKTYHQLQPLRPNSPVLMEIDVTQLNAILKRILE